MCAGLLLLVLVLDDPLDTSIVYGACDFIEINTFCDSETGQPNFTQLIGWTFYDDGSVHVCWWRMRTGREKWSRQSGQWLVSFWEHDTLIVIKTDRRYRTLTWHDPEIADRQALSKDNRRGF